MDRRAEGIYGNTDLTLQKVLLGKMGLAYATIGPLKCSLRCAKSINIHWIIKARSEKNAFINNFYMDYMLK